MQRLPKILIVDDDTANLTIIRRILKECHASLVECGSGEEALEKLKQHHFALILLDVHMPGMGGIETARHIRSIPRSQDTPIIFITANTAEDVELMQGYESGAVDYLIKPFNRKILLSKVHVFLRLHEAIQSSQQATQSKSQFLANMSHEIRTPLNGIIGLTELLMKTELSEKQRNYVNTISGSGELLLSLINDILDFSKIEAGEVSLQLESTNLQETIRQTMDVLVFRSIENDNELVLDYDDSIGNVLVDVTRLKQIIVNLIGNALKFTKRGHVLLRISQEKNTTNPTLLFEVIDNGIGIAPQRLEQVFQRFVQADASTVKEYGGSGLGLSICQNLVDLMGGNMGVESTVNQGSRFWFRIPLSTANEHSIESESVVSYASNMRVLVLDDAPINTGIISKFLSNWHIAHTCIHSAAEAIPTLIDAQASGSPYHTFITDYHMPDIDGAALASEIRKYPNFADLKLILATSIHKIGDVEYANDLGFDACLLKPIYPSKLRDILIEIYNTRPSTEPDTPNVNYGLPRYPAKVLLVEDAQVNRMMAEEMLMDMGCDVDIAANGIEAVNMYQDAQYDLIFMDCMMPQMDGYDATRAIRKIEEGSNTNTLIIAMTANAMEGDREECLHAGMDDYMAKPVKIGAIHQMLSRYIKASTEGAEQNIHFLDGFDEARFESYRLMMGDEFERAITDFMDYAETMIDTLKKAHQNQNLRELGIISRALHSVSSVIGATALADAAWRIQEEVYLRLTNELATPLPKEIIGKLLAAFASMHDIQNISKKQFGTK